MIMLRNNGVETEARLTAARTYRCYREQVADDNGFDDMRYFN